MQSCTMPHDAGDGGPTIAINSGRSSISSSLHGKDIELGTADHKSEVLEQAADLVLEILLGLDQQRPARQQRPDRVAMEDD
jgi:hypothetical protein